MLKQALAFVQSHQSLHCSRTCAKWAYIWHILLANAQTSLSVCEVLPEPSLLSHMHKMGMFMAFVISQCSNKPYHAYSLTRAFTAFANVQNGRTYGKLFQSMLRRDLACVKSCQSLHCSRTYTKWVCFRHLLSVNAKTSLTMRTVSPEPSLLSQMCKMGVHMAYSFGQYSDETKYACSLARAFTALTCAQNGRTYGIYHQSMLIGA